MYETIDYNHHGYTVKKNSETKLIPPQKLIDYVPLHTMSIKCEERTKHLVVLKYICNTVWQKLCYYMHIELHRE